MTSCTEDSKPSECPNAELVDSDEWDSGEAETQLFECECGMTTAKRHMHPTIADY